MNFKEAYRDRCSSIGLASRYGNSDALKDLLEAGGSVDVRDNRGWIALHEAAYHNHPDCLKLMLQSSCCKTDESLINQVTFEGETPVLLAARQGNADCVRLLIQHAADIGKSTHEGFSPLWEAVCCRSIECIGLLLSQCDSGGACGLDVNCKTYTGQTALHQAAETGQSQVASLLLQHGANIESYDDNHISPVFIASVFGQLETLKIIIETAKSQGKGNIVNEAACDKATPLFLAAQRGHTECVKLLLDNGADPHLQAESPTTLPVHAAVQLRHIGCMELLLAATSPSAIEECGITLMDVLLPNLHLDCIQTLLKHGVNLAEEFIVVPADMTEHNSYTVYPFITEQPFSFKHMSLMGLAVGGDGDIFRKRTDREPITRCLLEAGVSPDTQIMKEIPPIVAAIYTNNSEMVDILLEYGAESRIRDADFTGNIVVTMAAGLAPPSACLLQLFIKGHTPDSSFGRLCKKERRFSGKKWTIQKLLMCYPDRNPWLSFQRLKSLISLCWSPQLHPGLKDLVDNEGKWLELQQLAVECSTLAHLCRRKLFQWLASKTLYDEKCLSDVELPASLKQYLLTSTIGTCYHELSHRLFMDRKGRQEQASHNETI